MRQAAERARRREAESDFASCVVEGLSKTNKSLPCQFFYDARGSELFEEITQLAEYYPTRTEIGILEAHAAEMVECVCEGSALIEFGSGSSRKTQILLDRLPGLSAYVPVDVSPTALDDAKRRLQARYPSLDIRPVVGDFTDGANLPEDIKRRKKLGFFPGSTIGNFAPTGAVLLLRAMRKTLSPGGALVIGVDLKKDARVLVDAYDDRQGVTAAFNLNLLARMNSELGADFDLAAFRHEAIYDPLKGRIEMHLVSLKDQAVAVAGATFHFRAGEKIHTENSYKYSIEQFGELARLAGWSVKRVWTDANNWFSVQKLVAE